jgi:acetylglutamate kinase
MVEQAIGFVGEVTRVNPTILHSLVRDGYIPVVATVAVDSSGQALNVNADTAAGEVGSGAAAGGGAVLLLLPVLLRCSCSCTPCP